jgi:hypothetical protein
MNHGPWQDIIDPRTLKFYRHCVDVLTEEKVPFLVGGAYALAKYTGLERHTKDFDVFVRKTDAQRALQVLSDAGYESGMTFPHWLGKAYFEGAYVDIIFSSGNGVAEVDDQWFEHAVEGEVFGKKVLLCPAEEIIWSKAFIMERERFDGNDVAHLLQARGQDLDWERILRRFGPYWRVLLTHLILLGFIYPKERNVVPAKVIRSLLAKFESELDTPADIDKVCQGTLLSREQYLVDIGERGFRDARLLPEGTMSREDIRHWTNAISSK